MTVTSDICLLGTAMVPPATSRTAERTLAKRFAAGEPSAFDELVATHHAHVSRLTCRLMAWSSDAEDVVQEVFLAAYGQLGRFRGEASLATWLTSITLNKCRTHRRRAMLRWKVLRSWFDGQASAAAPPADLAARRTETSALVRAAVAKLGTRDREVIVLHYLEQRNVEEIAQLLGIARNATEVRLHRARRRLRDLLGNVMESMER